MANQNVASMLTLLFLIQLGCAFVTYCSQQSAVEAQKGLHEKKTLAGVSRIDWNNCTASNPSELDAFI